MCKCLDAAQSKELVVLRPLDRWMGQSCKLDRRRVSKKEFAEEHHCKHHVTDGDTAEEESDYGQDEQDESEENTDSLRKEGEEKSDAGGKGHAKVMRRTSKERVETAVVAAGAVLDAVCAGSGDGPAGDRGAADKVMSGLMVNGMIPDEMGGEVETKLD